MARHLDNSSRYPHMTHDWFMNIACSRQVPPRRLNRSAPEIAGIFSGDMFFTANSSLVGRSAASKGGVCATRADSRLSCPHGTYFHLPFTKGVSHAEWPKNEYAPTQPGGVIWCPRKALDIEWRPPRVEGLSKRPKKRLSKRP